MLNDYNQLQYNYGMMNANYENLQCQYHELNQKYSNLNNDYNSLTNYCNDHIHPDNIISTTLIAKEYGLMTQELNELLLHLKIIFKRNGTYCLNKIFANMNLVKYSTVNNNTVMYWTENGRRQIYIILAHYNILPYNDNSKELEYILNVNVIANLVNA